MVTVLEITGCAVDSGGAMLYHPATGSATELDWGELRDMVPADGEVPASLTPLPPPAQVTLATSLPPLPRTTAAVATGNGKCGRRKKRDGKGQGKGKRGRGKLGGGGKGKRGGKDTVEVDHEVSF